MEMTFKLKRSTHTIEVPGWVPITFMAILPALIDVLMRIDRKNWREMADQVIAIQAGIGLDTDGH